MSQTTGTSSTYQAAPSISNIQLTTNAALADYANLTGIDLSKNPFAATLEQANSPEAILQLFQQRERASKGYRDGNRQLIRCLSPAVNVIEAFSGILGEADSLVPFQLTKALFVGIDVLLASASDVSSRYDALLELFERLGNFLKRLEIYAVIPPTPIMTEVIVKIMVELLSVLALASKQIKEGRFKKFKKILGEREVEVVLQRLDRLTQEEALMTVEQTLGVVHGLVGNVKVVMEDGKAPTDSIRRDLVTLHETLNEIDKTRRDLLEKLYKTYEQTLLGIDEEKREYAQRLFKCLSASIRPLRIEELAEIFAVWSDPTTPASFDEDLRPPDAEEAVLSACSSLVAVVNWGESRIVQFSDSSVKEYLTSDRLATAEERLSYYHILPEAAHALFAHISLSVLLRLDDKIDRNTIAHFPLAPYAAQHWIDHAKFKDVSSHIQGDMERLFDPTKTHLAAWIWLYDIDRYWTEPLSATHPTHPTRPEAAPLYYASLCGFCRLVEHLIVAHLQDVNDRGGLHTTPLHAASVKGHLDVASLLLKSGADPDSRDDMGRVPLHLVSQGGQLVMGELLFETARLIVNSGENVNVADDKGWTPLHAAAHGRYREIAKLLIESGASLNVPDENQDIPLHLACFNGMRDIVPFLIERGSYINSRDEQGWIPLHAASRCGHVDVARLLIDRGADVNAQQEDRWIPLHLASRYGYLDLALLLVDCGANVNAQKEDRWTALHLASGGGHSDIAKLLIDRGANVDSRNDKRETPLALASWNGHLDIARFLIEMGATVSAPDKEGDTPLHLAANRGHLHVTKLLLECGTDVDIRNGYGQTSLYFASGNGKLDVVRFLIDQGANIHIGDINNSNPLHIASLKGYLDIVQLIINTGTPVDVRNGSQKTPLALASSEGKVEVGRFLIERGADMNARDDQSWAPIHFASRCGHVDIAQLLLDCGVDANVLEDNRWSPLHLASANDHLKSAELLVQHGASIDVFNNKLETPLYRAVTNGNAAIARLLIDHGATVHSADSDGWTLLHAASYNGHLEVLKLLLRRGADVDVINKANKTPAELALENGQADVAKFISEYKANANTRNKLWSTTLDTVEYGADDDGKDEAKDSLHAAAEEGNVNTVMSSLERVDINARSATSNSSSPVPVRYPDTKPSGPLPPAPSPILHRAARIPMLGHSNPVSSVAYGYRRRVRSPPNRSSAGGVTGDKVPVGGGLKELLADDDPRKPEDPIVDIIAVHGLGSKYPAAWMKNGTMWLKDFLPEDFPQARLLAFVYPSEDFENPDFVDLRALGGSLLRSVVKDQSWQYTKRRRPLIFIGHSFGGLVIKKALALSQVSNPFVEGDHGYIADATRGVLFLGTPHFGSQYASGGLWWARLSGVFGGTYTGLLKTLQLLSPELEHLNQDFLAIPAIRNLPQPSLVCFYETKGLLFGPVVEEQSACLSLATHVALNADHNDMNKFSDREGPYDDVKYCLQRIYESVAVMVDVESPMEDENHYIFAVKTTASEFDLVDCYPNDLWTIGRGVARLSMGGSGTSGCIMFQKKTSRERFAVTLGVHNYTPWTDIATNFKDESPQEIRDSYYGRGKRNVSSVTSGSRCISKPLAAGRSVSLTFDQEVDKKQYPTEVIVK